MLGRWCLALAIVPGIGCAALYNVVPERAERKVYGGTRGELSCIPVLVYGPEKGDPLPDFTRSMSGLALFDLPLTVVVDTLTLPLTVPVSIYRRYHPLPPDDPPSRPDVEVIKSLPPGAPRE